MAKHVDKLTVVFELDEDGWWCPCVTFPTGTCVSQAKTLRTARRRIRQALATWWDDSPRATRAKLTEEFVVSKTADRLVREMFEARAEAARHADQAKKASKKAVKALAKAGVATRDAGELLGISQARIAQIARS